MTEAIDLLEAARLLIPTGVTLLLVPGAYLAWAGKVEKTPWVAAGLVAMLVLAFLGAVVTGKRLQLVAASEGRELWAHLPTLWNSFVLRAFVMTAVIFVMSTKPGLVGTAAATAVALVGGLLVARATSPRPAEAVVSSDAA